MKILVCGSRKFADYQLMRQVLADIEERASITIIEGAAQGADLMARWLAVSLGCEVIEFPTQWNQYGKRAGIVRNQQMLDEGKPDRVIAFSMTYPLTPGTSDMVRRASAVGLPVEIHISAQVTL